MNQAKSIDVGLAVLRVVNVITEKDESGKVVPIGRWPLTFQDIADVCECSRERIRQIEARAMRKIRIKLRNEGAEQWRALEHFCLSGGDTHYYPMPFRNKACKRYA